MKPKRVKRDAMYASYFRLQSTVDNMLDLVSIVAALWVRRRVQPLERVVVVGRTY
jgi:hypothetical protein